MDNKFKLISTKRINAIIIALMLLFSFTCMFSMLGENALADQDPYFNSHSGVPSDSLKTLDLMVSYETLHVESGVPLYFFLTVTHNGLPVLGALIEFNSTDSNFSDFTYENRYTDEDGKAVVFLTAYSEEGMEIDIFATASLEGYTVGIDVIEKVTIEPPVNILNEENIPSYISITGIIAIIIIASTETGKYGLLKLLIVPLYSRLKKDELLEHFVRGQIYGHIMSHPGEHYNHIKQKLGVTNGTLSHHLRTLELQGYIKSHRDGTYKRFYPTGMKIPRKKGIQLSDLQMGMVDAIRQSPGISQKDIAQREGISQQSVSYNLAILERMGILDSVRDGVRKKYFISSDS